MNLLTLRGSYLLTLAHLLAVTAFDVPGAPTNSKDGLKDSISPRIPSSSTPGSQLSGDKQVASPDTSTSPPSNSTDTPIDPGNEMPASLGVREKRVGTCWMAAPSLTRRTPISLPLYDLIYSSLFSYRLNQIPLNDTKLLLPEMYSSYLRQQIDSDPATTWTDMSFLDLYRVFNTLLQLYGKNPADFSVTDVVASLDLLPELLTTTLVNILLLLVNFCWSMSCLCCVLRRRSDKVNPPSPASPTQPMLTWEV